MKAFLTLSMMSLFAANAFAGTASVGKSTGKTCVPPPAPAASPITGSVSVGYDSAYYFRGLWFSNNNLWGSVNLSIPVAEKLTLGVSALYTETVDTSVSGSDLDYSELDLAASLTYDAGWGKLGVVVTNYQFFDTFSGSINGKTFGFDNVSDSTIKNSTDIGLTAAIPMCPASNLYLGAWYDTKINAYYFEIGADYTHKINDSLSLVPAVQLGYASDYFTYAPVSGTDSDWTHFRVGISAPYKATSNITITPYVAANLSLGGREEINTVEDKNDIFGGVSVSYSF